MVQNWSIPKRAASDYRFTTRHPCLAHFIYGKKAYLAYFYLLQIDYDSNCCCHTMCHANKIHPIQSIFTIFPWNNRLLVPIFFFSSIHSSRNRNPLIFLHNNSTTPKRETTHSVYNRFFCLFSFYQTAHPKKNILKTRFGSHLSPPLAPVFFFLSHFYFCIENANFFFFAFREGITNGIGEGIGKMGGKLFIDGEPLLRHLLAMPLLSFFFLVHESRTILPFLPRHRHWHRHPSALFF